MQGPLRGKCKPQEEHGPIRAQKQNDAGGFEDLLEPRPPSMRLVASLSRGPSEANGGMRPQSLILGPQKVNL